MKYCTNNHSVSDNELFCGRCGSPVEEPTYVSQTEDEPHDGEYFQIPATVEGNGALPARNLNRAARPSRTPLVVGAASAAILLTGGIIFAAHRSNESLDVSQDVTTVQDNKIENVTGTEPSNQETAITSYENARPAVIQIVTDTGSESGSGSGFIISPEGLAVTNNHVVAGAATVEVYVGGDSGTRYPARVVGASECNDLALIDINAPQSLPYLEWFDGDVVAGTPVWTAGFPLGDPEFTVTGGTLARANADGNWIHASIDHAIEHDAVIRPGNSGGPLLNVDGKVVGVNFGTIQDESAPAAQYFAIAADAAKHVVDNLRNGNFEWIGLFGQTTIIDDLAGLPPFPGILVESVEPGSPASRVGLQPGDTLLSMNNLAVGEDGTFRDYCRVLRTAGDTGVINAQVLRRYDDGLEILRGEINGNTPLDVEFSYANDIGVEAGYRQVIDDTGTISMNVPASWTVDTRVNEYSVPTIVATDPEGIGSLILHANAGGQISVDEVIESGVGGVEHICTANAPEDYSDGTNVGKQVVLSCEDSGVEFAMVLIVAEPENRLYSLNLIAALNTTSGDLDEGDLAAFFQARQSMRVLSD